jgi:small subunit ribosomal protein S16
MATVIRMKRGGRTHAPYYRVVVIDSRNRALGPEIEEIGVYHPCARPKPRVEIDGRKALVWLYKGARPSDTVRNLLSNQGVMKAFADGVKPEELPGAPVEEAKTEAAPKAQTTDETEA